MNQQRRRGGGFVRGFVVLGVLALVAAGVAAYLMRDQGPSADGPETPSATPANLMATGGVEKSIRDRLTARTGRTVVAECPEKVDALVGTTFTCEARYEGDDEVRSIVSVEITGGGGQFEWSAEQAPDEATPTP